MKLCIIDCRNLRLDSLLSSTTASDPQILISIPLPNKSSELPFEIKQALQHCSNRRTRATIELNVCVEINQWLDKRTALSLLLDTSNLIDLFIGTQQTKKLVILDQHEFNQLSVDEIVEQLS